MRRTMLATASLMVLAAGPAEAEGETIIVSTYGINQEAFREILFDPFEKICGCEVVVEVGNNAERLAKLEADTDTYDMAVFADFGAQQAAESGLIQPIDVTRLANHQYLYEAARDPLGGHMAVGYTLYATSIAYRSDLVDGVESWTDLLGEAAAGQVGIPNITTTQGPLVLHMLALAEGSGDDTGFAGPIASIGEHKDDIVTFYERSSQLITLFGQEEVVMAPVGRYAWGRLLDTGLPMAWAEPAEGQTGGMNVMVMVAGTEHEDLVLQLMDTWISTEMQTALAERLVDSPANSAVELDAETAELLTYGADQIASIHFLPPATVLANREAWLDAWNTAIAR